MQAATQGKDPEKAERRNTGGLPVADDALPLKDTIRTPDSQGDRDDSLSRPGQNQKPPGHA